MGIERLLLCSIFFEDTSDLPTYGNGELVKRAELYKKANNVGTSNYQSFLTDPQPDPALVITTSNSFLMGSCAKPTVQEDSVSYVNQEGKLLGGILGLNSEEARLLHLKHMCDEDSE